MKGGLKTELPELVPAINTNNLDSINGNSFIGKSYPTTTHWDLSP